MVRRICGSLCVVVQVLVVVLAGVAGVVSTVGAGVAFASCRGDMIDLTTTRKQVLSWHESQCANPLGPQCMAWAKHMFAIHTQIANYNTSACVQETGKIPCPECEQYNRTHPGNMVKPPTGGSYPKSAREAILADIHRKPPEDRITLFADGGIVRYHAAPGGKAQGIDAYITKAMLGKGSEVPRTLKPPGYEQNLTDRGHLLGKRLGGIGNDSRNVFAQVMTHNRGVMNQFEKQIAGIVRNGDDVHYQATLLYQRGQVRPYGVYIKAEVINRQTGEIVNTITKTIPNN